MMDTRGQLTDKTFRNFCGVLATTAYVVILILDVTGAAATSTPSPIHHTHRVTGTADQSVTLSCAANDGVQLRDVTWSDKVYSEDESRPSIIFRSENNGARKIQQQHPNKDNYKVDENFRLTISNLQMSSDVGDYICTSTGPSGSHHERHYDLSVAGKPTCTVTKTTLKPGETARLSCEMAFGSAMVQPTINWLRDQEPVDSIDDNDAGIAKRDLDLTAVEDDDRRPYRCVTKLGNTENECNITLIVPHSVRQAQFVGSKRSYTVGEELKCSAKGSPYPDITLSSSSSAAAEGSTEERLPVPAKAERHNNGWRSIVIPEDWVRKHVTVNCTATNTVDGKRSSVTTSTSFSVAEAPRPAAGTGGAAQWSPSLLGTFMTSLSSLLMATWPIIFIGFIC